MNERGVNLSVAEISSEVADERIYPDAFDGFGVAMQSIELATSLGIPQILPVGSLVASACEAWLFDEGFQQHRPVGVAHMPVVRQALADQGEGARSEVAALDPGQDQESGETRLLVVDEPTRRNRPPTTIPPNHQARDDASHLDRQPAKHVRGLASCWQYL
jgi:hypothetical protein